MPEKMDTIVLFKRDFYQSDTITLKRINGDNPKFVKDISLDPSCFSNKCVDALANFLTDEGYFLKVINYGDSMNDLFSKDSMINYPKLHKTLGADVLVFLDYFNLKDLYSENESGFTFFMSSIKDKFPEFKNSTKVENIQANLLWIITFKDDATIYLCKQPDDLYYGNSVYPGLFGNDANHQLMLTNTAEYLGKAFAPNIIPSWENVERIYYRSNNDHMLVGEKYLLDNDWLNAAEVYNRQTSNKNRNIAAKATYNMALICEIEGHLEAATEWIERSDSIYKIKNPRHEFNCEQYSTILEKRQEDTKLLDKQIRNDANTQ